MRVDCPANISEWTMNIVPPTFTNTFDGTTNTLLYKGGSGYERIYYPIQATANRTITFFVEFCSPSGYSCSYGDTQVYFAITTDEPTGEKPIKEHNIVASVPMDGTTSNTPVLYTVSYTPSSSSTIYVVIDMGYMVDDVDTTLVYRNIIVESGIWYVQDGRLTHDFLSEPLTGNYIQPPYPPFWWYVENGRLTHAGLPERINLGAFADCTSLRRVIIPPSVKYIGEYAFANTALTSVTIARDCEFFPTSFPPRCIINYYN